MGKRNYERLSVIDFGRQLLESEDLDPIYCALSDLDVTQEQLHRWLVAYWCFYDAGMASYASERDGEDFWRIMMRAAVNSEDEPTPAGHRWPRASERRHFRGDQAVRAITELQEAYPHPADMVYKLMHGTHNAREVMDRAKAHRGFGPWVSFKVADMIDRCCGWELEFEDMEVLMYDSPKKAALMVWRQLQEYEDDAMPHPEVLVQCLRSACDYIRDCLGDMLAPPNHDRLIGIQEIETILCKWKSHMGGHYPLFNDTNEIRESVGPWQNHSKTAVGFIKGLPGQKE